MIAGTIGSLKALRVRGTRPHAEDNFRFAKMSAGPAAWMRDSASMSKPKAASTSEHESSAVSQHEENRAPAQAAIKAFTAAAARTEELPRPLPWKPQGRSCEARPSKAQATPSGLATPAVACARACGNELQVASRRPPEHGKVFQ